MMQAAAGGMCASSINQTQSNQSVGLQNLIQPSSNHAAMMGECRPSSSSTTMQMMGSGSSGQIVNSSLGNNVVNSVTGSGQSLNMNPSISTIGTSNQMQSTNQQSHQHQHQQHQLQHQQLQQQLQSHQHQHQQQQQQQQQQTSQIPSAADIGLMLSLLNPVDANQLANLDLNKLAMYLVSINVMKKKTIQPQYI